MNQKTKVKDYIFVDNYLSVKECDHLINFIKQKNLFLMNGTMLKTILLNRQTTDCSVADTDINFLDVCLLLLKDV